MKLVVHRKSEDSVCIIMRGIDINYIDKNIKITEKNSTIGIIICKQNNEYVIKYCSDDRIIDRENELI